MSSTLSAEDLRLLQYFWQEKRDLSCWTGFENALPRIEAEIPELARAWRAVVVAPRIVTAVLYYLRNQPHERSDSNTLTEDELSELWWVWTDREDFTGVTWFSARVRSLARDYPELIKAWLDYQSAQEAMDRAMQQVGRLADNLID